MPRAFLINRRKYSVADGGGSEPIRESSPEKCVSEAERSHLSDLPLRSDDEAWTEDVEEAKDVRRRQEREREWERERTAGPGGIGAKHRIDATSTTPPPPHHATPPPINDLYNLTQLAEISLTYFKQRLDSPDFVDSRRKKSKNEESRQREKSSSGHVCGKCGKSYSTSSNLIRHRQTHRSPEDKKARKCPQCGKVYVSMPAFSMHVRTHSLGCECHICGKCFSRPWLLQGHIRTHTGEKPFKCSVCNKAFADRSNLRAHIQTHSSSKPFTCTGCGKSFALKSYLCKHEESSCARMVGRIPNYTDEDSSPNSIEDSQDQDQDQNQDQDTLLDLSTWTSKSNQRTASPDCHHVRNQSHSKGLPPEKTTSKSYLASLDQFSSENSESSLTAIRTNVIKQLVSFSASGS